MRIFLKIIPVILISIIFYILIYNLYPKYNETIGLVKRLNELKNKEQEIKSLEKLVKTLSSNANIQQLLSQKETLNIWLPRKPKIEELIYSLSGLYQSLGLDFTGTNFSLEQQPKSFNPNILPVGIINFQLSVNLSSEKIVPFIDGLEKNTRLMKIKKVFLNSEGKSMFDVESYYLPEEK